MGLAMVLALLPALGLVAGMSLAALAFVRFSE